MLHFYILENTVDEQKDRVTARTYGCVIYLHFKNLSNNFNFLKIYFILPSFTCFYTTHHCSHFLNCLIYVLTGAWRITGGSWWL